MSATVCHVSVAANLSPEKNIMAALGEMGREMKITGLSPFYRTPAIGRPEQPDYLNGVVRAEYDGDARNLKSRVLRGIEEKLGRVRSADKYAARPVDLDILLFGNMVVRESGLSVPDDDLLKRPFLWAALLALDPEIVIPGLGALAGLVNLDEAVLLRRDEEFRGKLRERFGL